MTQTARQAQTPRAERLGFRLDEPTKALIERAAQVQQRKVSDFCLTALAEAAQQVIAEHEFLVTERQGPTMIYDPLIPPFEQNDRLRRAFAEYRRRVKR